MSTAIDSAGATNFARLQAKLTDQLHMRCGAREQYFKGCYRTVGAQMAKLSQGLHIGTLDMDEVTSEKDDIEVGHHNIGAYYWSKREFAKEICVSGRSLRYDQGNAVPLISARLAEADDAIMDKLLVEAACGPEIIGDQCAPTINKDICCIEHNGLGITPSKIVEVATAIRRWCPGTNIIIPITVDMHAQLTKFAEFTNSDFLLNGQHSVYEGQMLESKAWYGVKFKIVKDIRHINSKTGECQLRPLFKSEPYIPAGGAWDGETYVRHIPVWDMNAIVFEEMMAPSITVFDAWKQRRKPKGQIGIRIDHEMGFGIANPKERAVMKILETNKELCV